MDNSDNDLMSALIDEIALEGLDGITLDSLWVRLGVRYERSDHSLDFQSVSVQNFVFNHLIKDLTNEKTISMYLLSKNRATIQIYNRYKHVNEDTGTLMEDPDTVPDDVYGPVVPVNDQQVSGSSAEYNERKNVTKEVMTTNMCIEDIDKSYGLKKFVLVADQCHRSKALFGPYCEPNIDLTAIQYCILERIGRQRYLGEITVGKESGDYKLSPKTLFYYRKLMLRKKLIKKKQCILYNTKCVQNSHGLVFTLTRFATERLTVSEINAKKINDLLLNSENNEFDYEEMRNRLEMKAKHFRELIVGYSNNFQVFEVPKIGSTLQTKRCIRLLKPISDDVDEVEDIEDEDDEEMAISGDKSHSMLSVFNAGKILADRPMLSQALAVIESHESQEGISLKEVGRCLSLPRLESRSLVRYLEKTGAISSVMVDRGRQKVTLFTPKWRINEINPVLSGRRALNLKDSGMTTANYLKRSNLILDYVRKEELVEKIYVLKHLIRESEKNNNPYKICTKTVVRIVHKLAAEGLLRSIRTILRYQDRVKKLHFVCIPSITPDHPMVKEKINQIKFQWIGKYSIDIHSDKQMTHSLPQSSSNIVVNLVYQPSVARKYGLEPKMKKILTLYRFLFYLTYDFDKQNIPNTDWRFNIEPLPEGHKTKVCTIGEIVPRIPLSVFVKVIWISYIIPGLQELLDDPIAKHLTLSQISPEIRQCLLYKRKFAFNICEALVGLTYMGLVDTYHKEQTEKEKTIINVKNKFTLIANNIQTDYEFKTMKDFDNFEDSIKLHCFESCIGCTIDKRLFVHNLRNWTYTPSYKAKSSVSSNRLQKLSGNLSESIVNKENTDKKKKRKRSQSRKSTKKLKAIEPSVANVNNSMETVVPTVETPSTKKKITPKLKTDYDKIDLRAKSLLKKQRTDWTPEEDSFLLVCKVTSGLLDPHCPNYICVNRKVIRDELHKYYPEVSKDKTALACQRRITYMLKNPNTRQNVSDYIGEYRQLLTVNRPDLPKTAEQVWVDSFIKLLHEILDRMKGSLTNNADKQIATIRINSMEDLLSRFNIVSPPTNLLPVRGPLHEEPHNKVDIYVNAVTNVLLSSLLSKHCSASNQKIENKTFPQSLFRIYQRYPDSLIRSVVTKLSKYGVMTKVKKINLSVIKSRGITPYKITQNFLFLAQTKYNLESLLADQTISDDLFYIKNGTTGFDCAIVASLLASKSVRFYTHIPDNIVMLESDCPLFKSVRNAVRNPRDPKSTSRYALHILRQHITSNNADRTKHSADYLCVNQCRITAHSTDPFLINIENFENIFEIQKQFFTTDLKARPIGRISAEDKRLLEYIKSKRELGASVDELLTFKSAAEALDKSLNRFSEQKQIFKVGIRNFKWVSVDSVDPWLVRSQVITDSAPKPTDNEKNCIQYFARYWKQPDGSVDLRVVYKLLTAVLGHIMTNPCIPQQKLIDIFNQSLQPVQLFELIEMLKAIGCLQVIESPQISKPKLFQPKTNLLNEVKIIHYISTPDCIIRLQRLKKHFQID